LIWLFSLVLDIICFLISLVSSVLDIICFLIWLVSSVLDLAGLSGERRMTPAKPSQAKPSQDKPSQDKPSQAKPSQAKVLTGGGDLREAQVDVLLSVSHSCV
jgi:hypothetical protein